MSETSNRADKVDDDVLLQRLVACPRVGERYAHYRTGDTYRVGVGNEP